MPSLRYNIRTDWLFYLLVLGYGYLVFNMTARLWFGEGVNVFASYSNVSDPVEMLVDANKVYWSKTCFLFGTILLVALNFDFRTAAGIGATFWAVSLIVVFGTSPTLIAVASLGILLVVQQVWRRSIFVQTTPG